MPESAAEIAERWMGSIFPGANGNTTVGGSVNMVCELCLVGWFARRTRNGGPPHPKDTKCWICGQAGKAVSGWTTFRERHCSHP